MKINLVNENFQSNYLTNLLQARGVDDVQKFLNPTIDCLNDPKLLSNIDNGIQLLNKVINKDNSSILIVADCDVDGFTSAAIIYLYLKHLNPLQIITYLLHEHKQHGLEDQIENILNNYANVDLIIMPDSSSNDYEYHEQLKELNIPCLILDHHDVESNQQISTNACIINNQLSPLYPNKELTGAGITWQFCHYYGQLYNDNYYNELIDLAALGICGDMGSILNLENRYIMKQGFSSVKNYFFKQAITKQSFSMGGKITPLTVAFYIVPLMNAMIRVGSYEEKERLFLGLIDGHRLVECNKRGAKGSLEEVAIESLRECTNAKSKQTKITDQMVEQLEQKIYKHDLLENKILFVRLDDYDDFPSEVVGLVSMKLAAKFKRPTIVARLNIDGINKGSIRNISNCELTDFKKFLNDSGYFEWVQGHASAAGCAIIDANLSAFHQYANQALSNINFNEKNYDVNFIRDMEDYDLTDLIYDLAEPEECWGSNNNEPLIYIKNIYLMPEEYQIIGTKKDTLKIEKNGIVLIKFHANEMIQELNKCHEIKLNIIGKANINSWMGNQIPQIIIENYEVEDYLLEF